MRSHVYSWTKCDVVRTISHSERPISTPEWRLSPIYELWHIFFYSLVHQRESKLTNGGLYNGLSIGYIESYLLSTGLSHALITAGDHLYILSEKNWETKIAWLQCGIRLEWERQGSFQQQVGICIRAELGQRITLIVGYIRVSESFWFVEQGPICSGSWCYRETISAETVVTGHKFFPLCYTLSWSDNAYDYCR